MHNNSNFGAYQVNDGVGSMAFRGLASSSGNAAAAVATTANTVLPYQVKLKATNPVSKPSSLASKHAGGVAPHSSKLA